MTSGDARNEQESEDRSPDQHAGTVEASAGESISHAAFSADSDAHRPSVPAVPIAPGESQSYLSEYANYFYPPRFPNIADVGIALVLVFLGFLASLLLFFAALHFHLKGITTMQQAAKDVHYTLGMQAVWYGVTFVAAVLLFRAVWHTGFFAGIEWRIRSAIQARGRILVVAFVCFVLAMLDEFVLPGPANAPIEDFFRQPGAAWVMFAFGVTLAPFFEEMAFRGFLLPALCTAWDWTVEHIQHRPAAPPDAEGRTQWSLPAMAVGSVLTSIPFAMIHGAQTAYSLGPFLLLICVSLALCWIRLSTRSLAASTFTHACYNLMLFSLMWAGTGGFKHLDKL